MILDYKDINDLNRYKIMSDTVIPRPIAWIVTENNGVLNSGACVVKGQSRLPVLRLGFPAPIL